MASFGRMGSGRFGRLGSGAAGGRTPLPAGTVYASNAAHGGIPVGDDTTGDGTAAKPYLTIDKAFTQVSSGGTIALNGAPSSPAVYRHATLLTINKSVTIQPVFAYGAKICATTGSVNRVVNITISGGTVVFGKVIIDAETTYWACVTIADTAAAVSLTYNGTKFTNWILQGASFTSGTAAKLNVSYNGCIFEAGVCRGAITHLNLVEGGVTVLGGWMTITGLNLSTQGGISIMALAASVTTSISGMAISCTLDPTLTSTGLHYGIFIQNIANASVVNNSVGVLGAPGSRTGMCVQIKASNDGNARDSSGAVIRSNACVNTTNGGMHICVGTDTYAEAGVGLVDNAIIEDNTVTGNATSAAGAVHGIFNGSDGNSIIRRNIVDYVGIGIVDKQGDGAYIYNNIISRCKSSYLLQKGAVNSTMKHNTVVSSSGFETSIPLYTAGVNIAANCSGCVVEGNLFYGETPLFVVVDASQVVTFATNDYWATSAPVANAWRYQGANYANLAAWQGAQEASAIAVNPQFLGASNFDVSPAATGLDVVAADGAIPTDYLQRTFASPATAGAYQRQAA